LHLSIEGERLLAQSMGVANVGEGDLLASFAQLLSSDVEFSAHSILCLFHILVEQVWVQHFAILCVLRSLDLSRLW
jgi:hypothetical protein